MSEQDLSIIEKMLAKIAEYNQSTSEWTIHYDRLELDQINHLLIFPAAVLLDLAGIIEGDNVRNLVSEGFRADAQGDFLSMVSILNHVLDNLSFLMTFDSPPIHDKAPSGLLLGMTNFLLLYQALHYYLKDGDTECVFEWMETLVPEEMEPTVRFPQIMANIWVA